KTRPRRRLPQQSRLPSAPRRRRCRSARRRWRQKATLSLRPAQVRDVCVSRRSGRSGGRSNCSLRPAQVRDVCVGGGGRFLILHLLGQGRLAVFDVNEAKIVKSIPAPDDHTLFTAGMDKLFILSAGKTPGTPTRRVNCAPPPMAGSSASGTP